MNFKFWLVDIVGIIFSAAVSYFLSILGISIPITICISIILLFVMILVQLGLKYKETKIKLKEQNKKLSVKSSDIMSDSVDGNNLLFMALTQDIAEPLKVSLLEKSANEYNNIISALILANLYDYGVEKDGVILISGDKEKAFKVYKAMEEYDEYGVSHWMLGWYYQNNLVNESKLLNDNERLTVAKKYYEVSKNKGFPKAMNSLGNFIMFGYAGFDKNKDSGDMIAYYKAASEKGDNYATLNYGHYYLREYNLNKRIESLKKAEELYKKATEMKSPEGFVKLGVVKIEEYNKTNEVSCLIEAKKCFISLFQFGSNQFSAAGYFMLGNLLNQHPDIF